MVCESIQAGVSPNARCNLVGPGNTLVRKERLSIEATLTESCVPFMIQEFAWRFRIHWEFCRGKEGPRPPTLHSGSSTSPTPRHVSLLKMPTDRAPVQRTHWNGSLTEEGQEASYKANDVQNFSRKLTAGMARGDGNDHAGRSNRPSSKAAAREDRRRTLWGTLRI